MLEPLKRDPIGVEVLQLFRRVMGPDSRLDDHQAVQSFIAQLEEALQSAVANESRLRGLRGQALFASLVVALNGCEAMLTLDAGDIYGETGMQSGDFLLVLSDGSRLLVEVKTVAAKAMRQRVRAKDYEGLRRTAHMLDARPVYACFFHNSYLWTLVDADDLKPIPNGTNLELEQTHGIMRNALSLLGDQWIGTTPPVEMILIPEPETAPLWDEDIGADAELKLRIGQVEFYCGGKKLKTKEDRNLAYFLALFGGWPSRQEPHSSGGRLSEIRWVCEPEEPVPGQNFQMFGPLSSMFSRKFLWGVEGAPGSVPALDVTPQPGLLPVLFKREATGGDLPLWKFNLEPSDEAGTS